MDAGTDSNFSAAERDKLLTAMNWVIPPDESPGAGNERCYAHLLTLLVSMDSSIIEFYKVALPYLSPQDLRDPNHAFATLFINHVRDVYYGYPDTGAWEDIGFVVQG